MRRTVSGIMLTLLMLNMLTLTFNIQPAKAETGTIYIRADGSIDPPTAPISTLDKITYTLIGNITSIGYGIVVERNNIVIDGAGYTLNGSWHYPSRGIDLTRRSNVTIKNMRITAFGGGICLYSSSNNTIYANSIIANGGCGVSLSNCSNNSVYRNNITNDEDGVQVVYSSYNSIYENNITANSFSGIMLSFSSNNIIAGNNIISNPTGFWGGICLYEASHYNSIIENNIANNDGSGILL